MNDERGDQITSFFFACGIQRMAAMGLARMGVGGLRGMGENQIVKFSGGVER